MQAQIKKNSALIFILISVKTQTHQNSCIFTVVKRGGRCREDKISQPRRLLSADLGIQAAVQQSGGAHVQIQTNQL